MDASISIEHIREAREVVDPVFLRTPQFLSETISERLGVATILKVECVNPIRSFKGRGASYLLHRLGASGPPLVCASAGNFGQGMAFACRKAGRPLTVFAARAANPFKLDRMRALGAEVVLAGADFDEAKDAASAHAEKAGSIYVEDGREGAISEGAGTIAAELLELDTELDAVVVPVGNGALINGAGTWLRRLAPATRVIGVCPAGAPAMELSWKSGRVVTAPADTIADGISVRVPGREALELMRTTADAVVLVTDAQIVEAMRMLLRDAGVVAEPAGAAGLAAVAALRHEFAGLTVATPVTGGNVTEAQAREWLR